MSAVGAVSSPMGTCSRISRTAVGGSSLRSWTSRGGRRSSSSPRTASRCDAAHEPRRPGKTSRARFRRRRRQLMSASRLWRCVDLPTAPEPSPRIASVRTIGGVRLMRPERKNLAHLVQHRLRHRVSILLIAITSGISMIPAFSAWISRGAGQQRGATVSAIDSTPTSPIRSTVSRNTTSFCAASRMSAAAGSSRPTRRGGRAFPSSG